MELRAIEFNHDTTSSSTSALNLRRNGAEFVTVPEWQLGQVEPSRVAYSIADTRGQTITIQVRLASPTHTGGTAEVRARPAPAPLHLLTSGAPWAGAAETMAIRSMWEHHAGALGSVQPRRVEFGPDGESEFTTFALVDPPFVHRGVGSYFVSWEWQFRDGPLSLWQPFATTAHRVYALVDVPTAPWTQLPYDTRNSQLPWTDVLDWATMWASGTRDAASAATAITWNVFALGNGRIAYNCDFGAPSNYSFLAFDCTAFLQRLAGGFGNGPNVNCSDCATVVSTFANALGADLWQSQMFDTLQPFPVNPAQLIGQWQYGTICGTGVFNYHEVAWSGEAGVDDLVYDACLTGLLPRTLIPTVPAAMTFGRPGQPHYRALLATPSGQLLCRPQPQNRERRFVI